MHEIRCPVCPHHCALTDRFFGVCNSRMAKGGKSVSRTYGQIVSAGLDPIEKKPLARFYPGSQILSVGTTGCNLDCPFCQNCAIAHPEGTVRTVGIRPEELVEKALERKVSGNIGIAYTYNEPLIGYEFVRDTARIAKRQGLKNVVVTNGYTTDAVLGELLPLIDAWNIDLKGSDRFYRMLGGRLEPVMNTIRRAAQTAHVELTTLVIPGKNDDANEFEGLVQSVAAINPSIPLHISRFFPARRWRAIPATPIATLKAFQEIAEAHLAHVQLGNV